jgi:hypothetical protein
MARMNSRFLALIVFTLISAVAFPLHAMKLSDLGSSRITNWSQAGYPGEIPDIAINIINVKTVGAKGDGNTDDFNAIQNAINNAPNPSVIFFPAGVYRINSPLNLKSGVVLRGQGSDQSQLKFVSDSGCLNIKGSANGSYTPVNSGLSKGSVQLTVQDASKFQVGQGGEIRQEDIAAVDPTGEWANSGWVPDHVVGQMVKIVAINGNTLTVDPPLNFSFSSDKHPEVRPIQFIKQVGVEDLKILRVDTGTVSSNVNISYAADCWIRRIESDNTQQYHFSIDESLNLEIRDSYIHGAVSKGDGGLGYGVSLSWYSTAILVENNIFNELRHSMIIQLGVNGCVFGYNYAQHNYSDDTWDKPYISVHGHYPYMNLFEGNIVGWIGLADYWGACGPGNTLFRNRVVGTDKHQNFGPYRGISIDDHSNNQNIIGNELTGAQTAITFDGSADVSKGTSTGVILHGNNVHGTITWNSSYDRTLPNSFYLSSKPSFFGDQPWPSIGPDQQIGAGTIPAKLRYDEGKYVPQPAQAAIKAPTNLRIVK